MDSKIIVCNSNPLVIYSPFLYFEAAAALLSGSLALFKDRLVFAETVIGHVIRISPMTTLYYNILDLAAYHR